MSISSWHSFTEICYGIFYAKACIIYPTVPFLREKYTLEKVSKDGGYYENKVRLWARGISFLSCLGFSEFFCLQSQDNCWINLEISKFCPFCFNSINTEIAILLKIFNIILVCGLARLVYILMSIK